MTGRQTPTNLPSRDWCQRQHAEYLAVLICAYWRAKGKLVKTVVASSHDLGEGGCNTPGVVFCVRSDMVNGWPVNDVNSVVRE